MICRDKFMPWAAAGPMEQTHALRGAWSQPAPGELSLDQPNHSQPADPHVWKKNCNCVAVGLWDDEGFVTQRYCCSNWLTQGKGKHNKIKSKRGGLPDEMVITYPVD